MKTGKPRPVALTIAGSDSGGGAGIQADLKMFAALGVHGACAITCVTAQNPRAVTAMAAVNPRMVRRQLEAVFDEFAPAAVKTGMLVSGTVVRVVAEFFQNRSMARPGASRSGRRPGIYLVVDPVMVATSGTRLLTRAGIQRLENELLPLASLVTPNLAEAEHLGGLKIGTIEDMRLAARKIHARHGCAVLVKGGHLPGGMSAADIYYDGREEWLLDSPRLRGVKTHGTGCAYAAGICAGLALGVDLPGAVRLAKRRITAALAGGGWVGAHFVLDPFQRGGGRLRPDRH